MTANLPGFRILQLLVEPGIPWVGFHGRGTNPTDQPPQSTQQQESRAHPGHDLIWITGSEHKKLQHSLTWLAAGQAAGPLLLTAGGFLG